MAVPIVSDAIPPDVLEICRRLRAAGHQAHLVGGGVRDLLMGRKPGDFDVATDALPQRTLQLFGERFAIPTGLQHGTITVLGAELPRAGGGAPGDDGPPRRRHVEVTTFRGEGAYLDGRRPSQVTFSVTLPEDLSRRDFTMNAIAYDPLDEVLTDPWDGQGDIQRKLVRAVGDPFLRFSEDGLRPMRAVRQATQLGFEIDPPTLAAIPRTLASFRMVAMERIRDELLKLLAAERPGRGLELMRQAGLLHEVLPELEEGIDCPQNSHHRYDVYRHTLAVLDEVQDPDPITRLGALLHDVAKPRTRAEKPDAPGEFSFWKHEYLGAELAENIARRLKLSNEQRDRVVGLVAHHMFFYTPEWTDGTVRRFVKRVGTDNLDALLALREADVAGRGFGEARDKETRELRERIARVAHEDAALSVRDLAIGGHEVMRILGVPGGRVVGQVLEALLERVIDEPALNRREALEALVPEVAAAARGEPRPAEPGRTRAG